MKSREKFIQLLNEFESKKEKYYNNYYSKYIIKYEIIDDQIKVISNVGDYRMVKNTKENMGKINHTINKNKILISKRIDEYEDSSKERLIVLLFNILILCSLGILVPLTFFIGNYWLLIISILSFSLSVMGTSISGLNYFMLVKEIKHLKKITGYKKEREFDLSDFKVKAKELN